MAATLVTATDAILSTLKARWDSDTAAITGGAVPKLVYEMLEPDLKPHPRDSDDPWARVTIRHTDANKATLNNSAGLARYRRDGLVWVQVFTPRKGALYYTMAQALGAVAQHAYEGRRAAQGNAVVFTKAALLEQNPESAWFRYDVKVNFYWDEIHN